MGDDKPNPVSWLQASNLFTNLFDNTWHYYDVETEHDGEDHGEDDGDGDGNLCHLGQVWQETVCRCLGCIGSPERFIMIIHMTLMKGITKFPGQF